MRLSGDEPGAAIFISVFFIKLCFIPIRPQQDIRHPFRGSSHLFADSFQVNAGAAFNDQLIVDMSDDEAVPEGFHGVAEDIPADGLNDIFHKFRPVGFDTFPFLCGAYAFISDGFPAELIDPDPGFDIGQPPTGGKLDEEHSALIKEADAADFRWNALCDRSFDGTVHIPPECSNHRIRGTPGVYQWLEFFFRQTHVESTH